MKRILIVEDEAPVRENLVELLETNGYDCMQAENGIAALDLLTKTTPSLIISDIMMPGIDGFEFYKKVKNKLFENSIPFIFLTAKMDHQTSEKSMALGADGFITKPYKARELLDRIKVRIEKKEKTDEKFEQLKMNISLYVPHELKTPLIPVLGFSQMLIDDLNGFTDEEKLEMLTAINRGGHRFKERVEKFTVYTELKLEETEPYKKVLEKFNTSDSNIISIIQKSYHCKERFKDIELFLASYELRITKNHFESLLFELIENACKFSPSGSKIKVLSKIEDNNFILCVTSKGNKIEMDLLEDFHQQDKRNYQQIGNGLGLSIVRLIKEKYNIKLDFDYDNKNGNTITLIFD